MAAFLLYLKNYKKTMGIGKMFRETILYKMGRGKLLRNYWPFSPSTFVTIPRSNGGFKLTRNNKLKCVSGLVNSDTFYKAPLIAKCFIIVRVYPANCFEINIPINFCMVISSCISDIFGKKPLTILLGSKLPIFHQPCIANRYVHWL